MYNNTKIANNTIPLKLISYQEVITIHNGEKFLSSVNVLIEKKIIKRIRFEQCEKLYLQNIGKEIAIQYLKNALYSKKGKKSTRERKNKKVNKDAANEAAKDLLSELGL